MSMFLSGGKTPVKSKPTIPFWLQPVDCKRSETTLNGKPACKGQIIFSETFEGNLINSDNWSNDIFMSYHPVSLINFYHNSVWHFSIKLNKLFVYMVLANWFSVKLKEQFNKIIILI